MITHLILVRALVLLLLAAFLSGCVSSGSRGMALSAPPKNDTPFAQPDQKDQWSDRDNRWLFWDPASPSNQQVERGPVAGGLQLLLTTESRLNIFDGATHPLSVVVFQLADSSAFNRLVMNKTSLAQLLLEPENLTGAISFVTFTLGPSDVISKSLTLEAGVTQLGIAAGFASLVDTQSTRLISVPLVAESQPQKGQYLTEIISDKLGSLFGSEDEEFEAASFRTPMLQLELDFGSQQIDRVAVSAF